MIKILNTASKQPQNNFIFHSQKKMVGSLDRVIQTSLDVKCLQKECNWVGCIKDFKVCKLFFIHDRIFKR